MSNTFDIRRFVLLWKQHFIQNTQFLFLAGVAYVGVIFIVLSMAQIGNDLNPHDAQNFTGFLLAFIGIFGVLYVGYSFPAFRTKEKTINFLMVPGSTLEKFLFELISRIGIIFILLPVLFWLTFHMQGYFLTLFTEKVFEPVGFEFIDAIQLVNVHDSGWLPTMIISGFLLAFVLAFTGATMFVKQPLVKTLFAVALIITFYTSIAYIMIVPLGFREYNPPETMWLFPNHEAAAFRYVSVALIISILVMLFVSYRKLKEKEV